MDFMTIIVQQNLFKSNPYLQFKYQRNSKTTEIINHTLNSKFMKYFFFTQILVN
jgi:hypothetical protein